ncbi:LacI family DNA-binding transcriptional regulator [Bifidobacterium choloepi]|nr:LacI family DNA-binding transcriptional regulator [Bifidobacterium choloepi]
MAMGDNGAATIRDVAKLAGVAVSTASRALGGGSASSRTRAKVQEAARQLNFVPNQSARRLTGRRSGVVALVVDESTNALFQDDFISALLGQLGVSLAGAGLLPFLVLAPPDDAEGFRELLGRSEADGVIVASMHEGHHLAGMLEHLDRPVVFIGRPPGKIKCPYVDVDNYGGGYLAGRRLLERGCRRMAVIEGPKDMPTPYDRTAGFTDALAEEGLEPVMKISGSYDMEHGLAAMAAVLEAVPDVDGVFAHSDKIAAGALRVLHQEGRRVPEDVAIIGFDDLQAARLLTPQLTTLAQPLPDMAQAATEMLEHRLEHGEWKVSAQRFPVHLTVRDSA